MFQYSRPIKPARHAKPHEVTVVGGKTWGQRMSDNKKSKINPIEYFTEQHLKYSNTTENMQKLEEGMGHAQGKTYYMNVPADSVFKGHLHELGKYQRPQLEGMYNQHEELQEGATDMMVKRINYGMV